MESQINQIGSCLKTILEKLVALESKIGQVETRLSTFDNSTNFKFAELKTATAEIVDSLKGVQNVGSATKTPVAAGDKKKPQTPRPEFIARMIQAKTSVKITFADKLVEVDDLVSRLLSADKKKDFYSQVRIYMLETERNIFTPEETTSKRDLTHPFRHFCSSLNTAIGQTKASNDMFEKVKLAILGNVEHVEEPVTVVAPVVVTAPTPATNFIAAPETASTSSFDFSSLLTKSS